MISNKQIHNEEILEIGAGTLNHLKYEKNYSVYDIVELFKNLYQDSIEIKKLIISMNLYLKLRIKIRSDNFNNDF